MVKLGTVPGIHSELALVDGYLTEYVRSWAADGAVTEVLEAVMASSGKRVRPILLLLCGRFGPAYPDCSERLGKLGAIVELIHMASLVHDDVVDDSPLRRGQETIQSRFGKDMAVYTGDLLLGRILYYLLLEDFREAGLVLAETVDSMCRGELGQHACRFDPETTLDQYLANVQGKTAALFSTACRIGAMESGCSGEVVEQLSLMGEHLGYLFQIRDDLLDFESSEQREGKPVHADFREGVYTLPVLYALRGPLGGRLRELIGYTRDRGVTPMDIAEMDRTVRLSGGIAFARSHMLMHAARARKILSSLPDNESSRAVFDLVEALDSI